MSQKELFIVAEVSLSQEVDEWEIEVKHTTWRVDISWLAGELYEFRKALDNSDLGYDKLFLVTFKRGVDDDNSDSRYCIHSYAYISDEIYSL